MTIQTNSNRTSDISVLLGEDAWQGDADAIVSVDGNVVFNGAVTALQGGRGQSVDLGAFDATVSHDVKVAFTNDAYGGTTATDRNLYVDDVLTAGVSTGDKSTLLSNGSVDFTVAPVPAPTVQTIGTGADTIAIQVSEDAWQGDAQFQVYVDGQAVGGVQTATASHSAHGEQTVDVAANLSAGSHKVGVQFLNDAYGGTAATDRNLYVDSVSVDGADQKQSASLFSNGTSTLQVVEAAAPVIAAVTAPTIGTGADTIAIQVSEDAWQGDAQFQVYVDGQAIGGIQTATASHAAHGEQTLDVAANLSAGAHKIGVQFTNDAYGGTSATDRNLYVDSVSVDGADQKQSASLFSNGTSVLQVVEAAAPVIPTPSNPPTVVSGSGPDTVDVQVSEDAWQGDAQFTVSVDGNEINGAMTTTASHASGQVQDFQVKGTFGPGAHSVAVSFVNDQYGGSTSMDRNLYVNGISLDGTAAPNATKALLTNASDTVSITPTAGAVPPTTVPAAPLLPAPTGADSTVGLLSSVPTAVIPAGAKVETVGVGKQFQTIGAAVAAATDGTVILVDAGTYTNDFATNNAKVSLYAVGGRVEDVATVSPPNYKGLFTTENDLTLVGFDVSGVRIPDEFGHNGAGVRDDNGNLTLIDDEFSQNQDGILTNAGSYNVVIDHTVFDDNGGNDGNGAGNIHNVYIGDVASVTATNSIFENAQVGHEFKSRANVNTITNNEFISGVGIGTGSYDIDLPNGGKDTVSDNTIIKGPNAENSAMLHFGGEGIPYSGSSLTVTGNVFQNVGGANGAPILNQTAISAKVTDNEFKSVDLANISQGPSNLSGNYDADGNPIQNQTLSGVLPGSTEVFTDSAAHSVMLANGNLQAVEGGIGALAVTAQQGHIVVIGGTGGLSFKEVGGSGGNQVTTVAGATDTIDLTTGVGGDSIDSEGQDTILAGPGNQTVVLNGTSQVVAGSGNSQWSVGGVSSIVLGSGSSFISVGSTGSVVVSGTNDYWSLNANGGSAKWDAHNAGSEMVGSAQGVGFSMEVYSGSEHIKSAGGAGSVLSLDAGDASVVDTGPGIVRAGSGNVSVIVNAGSDVYAGTGQLSVFAHGGGGGSNVHAAAGDVVVDGDSGGINYIGGASANTIEAKLSNISIVGGAGTLTVNGGSRDTVVGGSGGLVYNGFSGGANDVTTVAGSKNVLQVNADTVHSYGTDAIVHQVGNDYLDIHGNSSLDTKAGNVNVDLHGSDIVVDEGNGGTFNVFAGATLTATLAGGATIHDQGSYVSATFTDATNGGAVSKMVVSSGAADIGSSPGAGMFATTTAGGSAVVTTDGPSTVDSKGADAIHFGSGSDNVSLGGDGAVVWGGSGNLTVGNDGATTGSFVVHGGTGSTGINLWASHVTYDGGSGAANLTGGGSYAVVAGSGDITAQQNYGVDITSFVGGSGKATLSLGGAGSDVTFGTGTSSIHDLGWGGVDTFRFLAGQNGTDSIDNFRVGTDHAILGQGVSVSSAAVVSGSAQFLLSDGAHVAFNGVGSTSGIFG